MTRALAVTAALGLAAITTSAVVLASDEAPRIVRPVPKVDGHGVKWWAARARENGEAMRWQRRRALKLETRLRVEIPPARYAATEAIAYVFGPYADQALRVVHCETGGTYSIYAENGQYLGLFQMGSSERARYGHGWNAWAQAVSAYRYFAASGFDWSPWSCKPR